VTQNQILELFLIGLACVAVVAALWLGKRWFKSTAVILPGDQARLRFAAASGAASGSDESAPVVRRSTVWT